MNRFLTKKRGKDAEHAAENGLPELTSPTEPKEPKEPKELKEPSVAAPPVQSKKKGWGKRKKVPEPQPVLDLKLALPVAESFRTSMIMSNMSTRFSMLREMDDPKSLLGKASDDSILRPRRRSRLGEHCFSTTALNDISESASITSDIRAPFASQRNGSSTYGDGYTTDEDSPVGGTMMSRARPGEGNMLFGGRQKIYRIPIGDAGSVNNLGSGEYRGMRGRALYEDDVATSSFQRLREEERARQREERLAELDAEMDELRKDSLNSPSFTYSEKRETVSSTNSGPSMMSQSTAATSVANSAPASSPVLQSSGSTSDRSKLRRLYEQGLDQHMQDQQSVAAGRLTSMKRSPSNHSTASGPSHSRSAGNLRDRLDTNIFRSASPLSPRDRSAPTSSKPTTPLLPSNDATLPSQPLSPDAAGTDREKALYQALNPLDRGMATAIGQFNRPKQFNEEQFLQRQMSLAQQQQKQQRKGSRSPATAPSPVEEADPQERQPQGGPRSRTATNRTDRSWSNSSMTNDQAFSAKPQPVTKSDISSKDSQSAASGTFFASNDTDDESDSSFDRVPERSESEPTDEETVSGAEAAPGFTHPALRLPDKVPSPTSPKQKRNAWSPEALQSGLHDSVFAFPTTPTTPAEERFPDNFAPPQEEYDPERNGNLKGLVRDHLRHPSNSSSIYPTSQAPMDQSHEFDLRVPSMYITQNPWEQDDFQPPPLPRSSYRFNAAGDYANGMSPDIRPPPTPVTDWEEELQAHHAKNASTETAYERRAFNSELAQRQRTIQENLRVKVETDERTPPTSSLSPSKNVFESGLRPFLRVKSSKEAMLPVPRELPQSLQAERERSLSGQRPKRDNPMSQPPIGRTLHSKMPRQEEDAVWTPNGSKSSSRARRSAENTRPDTASSRSQNQSRPDSRTSSSRFRSGSDSQPPPSRDSNRSRKASEPARPSIDTRHDSGTARLPMSAPAADGHNRNTLAGSALQRDTVRPSPFTANSTGNPALSSTSSAPNFYTAPPQPRSAGTHSPDYPQSDYAPAPSTGFFFPPTPTDIVSNPTPGPRRNTTSPTSSGPRIIARRPRKLTITKEDISEPTLIASTRSAATVDLPEGASLRNGLRNDFDVVLGLARDRAAAAAAASDETASAPSPSVGTGGDSSASATRARKPAWLRGLGRRESSEKENESPVTGDEPEPRRFRIRRLEDGEGKVGHRALRAAAGGEGEL